LAGSEYKKSGYGRDNGNEVIGAFTEVKAVRISKNLRVSIKDLQ
jgi:acyl-CoA reductase-like NAD-dependent aldehyde dehydrogenase